MLIRVVFTFAQLFRGHDVSSGLIVYCIMLYVGGVGVEGPGHSEKQYVARIAELERMVGRLTMENELLKKAVEYTARRRKEFSSPITAKTLATSRGGAK